MSVLVDGGSILCLTLNHSNVFYKWKVESGKWNMIHLNHFLVLSFWVRNFIIVEFIKYYHLSKLMINFNYKPLHLKTWYTSMDLWDLVKKDTVKACSLNDSILLAKF